MAKRGALVKARAGASRHFRRKRDAILWWVQAFHMAIARRRVDDGSMAGPTNGKVLFAYHILPWCDVQVFDGKTP